MTLHIKTLPKGWSWAELQEVSRVYAGSSAPQGAGFFSPDGVPFFRVSDLSVLRRTTNLVEARDKIAPKHINDLSLVLAKKGTVVFPKSGAAVATNNRGILGIDGYIVSHLMALEAIQGKAMPEWLYYTLCGIDMKDYSNNDGYFSLQKSKVEKIKIPLPLLVSEQKRIVAKLDKRLAAIAKAKQAAEKQLADIKLLPNILLRQALIAKMPKNWQMVELGDVLNYEQPGPYVVSSVNYAPNFKTPVLTAGKSFVLGYTNELNNIYPVGKLPVIIFDDFTTAIQYVDFPFKVKSSAMKILSLKDSSVADIKFIYNVMCNIEFDATTHKRYWIAEYSKIKFPLPPLSYQKRIVEDLNKQLSAAETARKAAEQQLADINQLTNAIIRETITP